MLHSHNKEVKKMSVIYRKFRNRIGIIDLDYERMKFRLLNKEKAATRIANTMAALGTAIALCYGIFATEKIMAVFIEKGFSLPKNLMSLKG